MAKRRLRDSLIRGAIPLVLGPLLTAGGLYYLDGVFRNASPGGHAPTILDFGRHPGAPAPPRLKPRAARQVANAAGGGVVDIGNAPPPAASNAPEVRTGAAVNDPMFTRGRTPAQPDFDALYRRVTVVDATHFRIVDGGKAVTVRLAGIKGPLFTEKCDAPGGASWKCGARARAELARLIGPRAVGCRDISDEGDGGRVADCFVGGRNLAQWLVAQGWADPETAGDPLFAAALKAARDGRLGRNGDPPDDRPLIGVGPAEGAASGGF